MDIKLYVVFNMMLVFAVAQDTNGVKPVTSNIGEPLVFSNSSGSFRVQENTKHMTYIIEIQNISSIIDMVMTPGNISKPMQSDILINILENGRNTTWTLESGQPLSYLSSNFSFSITFTGTTDWVDLDFTYEEIKFDVQFRERNDEIGVLTQDTFGHDFFKPNMLLITQISPLKGVWNDSKVQVTLKKLKLDETRADYLMIGAGKEPLSGPPLALLTETVKSPRKYEFESEDVHIVFYHRVRATPNFEIRWKRTGNRIIEPDGIPDSAIPDSVLQAAQLCVYNSSWVPEFNFTDEPPFAITLLQEKFAFVANQYAKEKGLKLFSEISASSVQIFRISTVVNPDQNFPTGVIYTMITVTQSFDVNLAVFRWQQLEEIVSRFDSYDAANKHFFGFRIGSCPEEAVNYKWWYLSMAVILVLLSTFFVGVWICTYNTMWRSWQIRVRRQAFVKKLSCLEKQDQNYYVAYENPTMSLTDEKKRQPSSRRYTSILSDEESDTEIFDSNWTATKRKSDAETPQWTDVPPNQMFMLRNFQIEKEMIKSKITSAKNSLEKPKEGEEMLDQPDLIQIPLNSDKKTESRF